MKNANSYLTILLLWAVTLPKVTAQISTFDTNAEGWSLNGDAASPIPIYHATGGNPGGHIQAYDNPSGDVWYWVAPERYRGNRCVAYNGLLKYDLIQNDVTQQHTYLTTPDVIFFGGGLKLVCDAGSNPGLNWTHYEIPLNENGGWHLNTLDGPVPTKDQFLAFISNVSNLWIRGEYKRYEDNGRLDNVYLDITFLLDLDGNNSSGVPFEGYRADSICTGTARIADDDIVFKLETNVDSITIDLPVLLDGPAEFLEITGTNPNITISGNLSTHIVLTNKGNASTDDFAALIKTVLYHNLLPNPRRALREVKVSAHNICGKMSTSTAFIPVYPKGYAGIGQNATVCVGAPVVDLIEFLDDNPDTDGIWKPALAAGNSIFNPNTDLAGDYLYIVKGAPYCGDDSTSLTVTVRQPLDLGADTVICRGDTLRLDYSSLPFDQWNWSNGTRQPTIDITEPKTYVATVTDGECIFIDSISIKDYNCERCQVFSPNVFSPDDNGDNDYFQVFTPCALFAFDLKIFDRWGEVVFHGIDVAQSWDGFVKGRLAQAGVYVWVLEIETEYLGEKVKERKSGSVAIIR